MSQEPENTVATIPFHWADTAWGEAGFKPVAWLCSVASRCFWQFTLRKAFRSWGPLEIPIGL